MTAVLKGLYRRWVTAYDCGRLVCAMLKMHRTTSSYQWMMQRSVKQRLSSQYIADFDGGVSGLSAFVNEAKYDCGIEVSASYRPQVPRETCVALNDLHAHAEDLRCAATNA